MAILTKVKTFYCGIILRWTNYRVFFLGANRKWEIVKEIPAVWLIVLVTLFKMGTWIIFSLLISISLIIFWTWEATWVVSPGWFNFNSKLNLFTPGLGRFESTGNLTFDPRVKRSKNIAHLVVPSDYIHLQFQFLQISDKTVEFWLSIYCASWYLLWTSQTNFRREKIV